VGFESLDNMGCQCSKFDKANEANMESSSSFYELIKQQIEDYPVLLYSRSTCQQSSTVKQILRRHALQFEYFEIDHMRKLYTGDDSAEAIAALQTITGRRTTPFLFVRGRFCVNVEDVEAVLKQANVPRRTTRPSVICQD
jgi:glutaredoxin